MSNAQQASGPNGASTAFQKSGNMAARAGKVALIVGAGGVLGPALMKAFGREGLITAGISRRGVSAPNSYQCDATDEAQVAHTLKQVHSDLGTPAVVVVNIGVPLRGGIHDISAMQLEQSWRQGCLAGFIVARAAIDHMNGDGGTLIFSGAGESRRRGGDAMALSVASAGLLMVAKCVATDLGPLGLHVAYVKIDGEIGGALSAKDVAESYVALYRQPRRAWTQELDLRAFDDAS